MNKFFFENYNSNLKYGVKSESFDPIFRPKMGKSAVDLEFVFVFRRPIWGSNARSESSKFKKGLVLRLIGVCYIYIPIRILILRAVLPLARSKIKPHKYIWA